MLEMTIKLLFLLLSSLLSGGDCLIRLDWETLASEVTIRHFSASNYFNEKDPATVWNEMGGNITCSIDPATLTPTLSLPSSFDPAKPMKLHTHGFMDTTAGEGTLSKHTYFVNAWMDRYGGDYDVILVDWHNLAWFLQISSWDDYIYDLAARNSIDVGEFVGRCLAGVIQQQGTGALHFSGHSLGAHLVGKIGRTIDEVTGQKVARITGLDPAGPRFVDGPLVDAIPELHANLLSPDSAQFVDIIHTNGALKPAVIYVPPRAGALEQLGHMDFYPDGGSSQGGCIFGQDALPGGVCSHDRSVLYFLWSIIDEDLFPSQICTSVERCNNEESEGPTVAFMGEPAPQSFTGTRQLFYHDIYDCHWDFDEHNTWLCA